MGMEWYCRIFGRCYQLLGGSQEPLFCSHTADGSAVHPWTPPRLDELHSILAIVRAWHAHNSQLPGTPKERASRGFSHQLFWDTQMMIEGFLGLLADLQQRHGSYVVRTRMLNQDSLESMFGRIRMACGSGKDPNLFKVVHTVPRVEAIAQARAGLAIGYQQQRATNSGQAGQVGPIVPMSPAWLERQRIRLPPDFAQRCLTARGQLASHEVLWQHLSEIQLADESLPLGQAKLMHWLTRAKHILKTGFSRMRVGLATAVLCGDKGQVMADVLQEMRYAQRPGT